MNLMDAPDVIQRMRSFSNRKMLCHVLDLRHWFHQIRVSGPTRDLFNIRCSQRVFRWEVLPMGWSFSSHMSVSSVDCDTRLYNALPRRL